MILTPMSHDHAGDANLLGDLRAGPFRVTHKRYTHDFAQAYHEHDAGSIDFVLEGSGRGVYGGREIESCAGMVEFFREELRHKFIGGGGGIRTMHVLLPGDMLRGSEDLRDIALETLTHTRAQSIALSILRELHDPDESSTLEIESLIHELIDEIARASARPRARAGWIGPVRDYLHDMQDRPVTLTELAEHAGVNRAHLARVFKAKLGVSVGAYHRAMRAQLAAQRIARNGASIARVARETGFSDQAHLTRVFRERFGITPSAYRRCLRRR